MVLQEKWKILRNKERTKIRLCSMSVYNTLYLVSMTHNTYFQRQ